MTMVERVARAIDSVQLWERFNDWTSDHVYGLPVEICRYGNDGEDEIIVVERHSVYERDGRALGIAVCRARARAAIAAMREPDIGMIDAGEHAAWDHDNSMPAFKAIPTAWSAMIDAALAE